MANESSFIRRKRKESNFTQLPNEMLRDTRISWKARGLLAYMLSMPDDWVFYESELVKHSESDGITSLRSAMKELKVIGYVCKEAIKGEDGRIIKWATYVDETPIHNTENLQSGKPTIRENHNVEDSTLLIPINTNTENTNIKPMLDKPSVTELDVELELEFDDFYKLYPKKVERKRALTIYKKVRKKYSEEHIINGLLKYIDWIKLSGTQTQYIKGPAVYLNGENFNDEYDSTSFKQQQKNISPWRKDAYGETGSSAINDDDRKCLPERVQGGERISLSNILRSTSEL